MTYQFGKTVVIGLGGSIISPDEIDVLFLQKFRALVKRYVARGTKFIIVTGGGRVARMYQEAARKLGKVEDSDGDWMGIQGTRCNAYLLRTIFRGIVDPVIFHERHARERLQYPVTISSGWDPGWSTDADAMFLAHDFGVAETIAAGKPAFVYDKDPTKYKNAKPFTDITWSEYRKIIPKTWTPGAHTPVDPVAARYGHKHKIAALVVNGKDIKNFDNLLGGKEFRGTLVS